MEREWTKGNFILIPDSVSQLAEARVIQSTHIRNPSLVLSTREPTKAFKGS